MKGGKGKGKAGGKPAPSEDLELERASMAKEMKRLEKKKAEELQRVMGRMGRMGRETSKLKAMLAAAVETDDVAKEAADDAGLRFEGKEPGKKAVKAVKEAKATKAEKDDAKEEEKTTTKIGVPPAISTAPAGGAGGAGGEGLSPDPLSGVSKSSEDTSDMPLSEDTGEGEEGGEVQNGEGGYRPFFSNVSEAEVAALISGAGKGPSKGGKGAGGKKGASSAASPNGFDQQPDFTPV